MAALAYVLLPVSGLIAFFWGGDRGRLHGFQAIVLGVVWPLLLMGGSLISPGFTQVVFIAGAAVWLALIVTTAFGRDPRLPGSRHFLG
jgi:hypothetical protein